jgi:hypothetical protein
LLTEAKRSDAKLSDSCRQKPGCVVTMHCEWLNEQLETSSLKPGPEQMALVWA